MPRRRAQDSGWRTAFGGNSNNAFPFFISLRARTIPPLAPPLRFARRRQRASSVLNNNGIAQVGLLENICPFPRTSFSPRLCRDSFGLPHNDASRLWSSHSRIHRGEKTRRGRAGSTPLPVRLPSFPLPARRFNCCANICLAGISAATVCERRNVVGHVNNTITGRGNALSIPSSSSSSLPRFFRRLASATCRLA